ncbi:TlpA disulfide reductase family protein [Hyphomonas sp.]|uniref:TlpA family protein disulfide reductase n=1 Tax=Hyphomonas sp. TaxID=87 RepID=UPI0025BF4213|nr:TlpA disulfide reductase family protein [Hyphomonas sp.]
MTRLAYFALFLVGLIAIVYALISAIGGNPPENRLQRYAEGEIAKLDFSRSGTSAATAAFYRADGTPVILQDYAGKVVLVNFWATWCAPCEREMPSLGALQTARGGDRFEVIAISVDSEADKAYAAQRLGELGASNITFHSATPEQYEIVYDSGVQGFPTTILYDAGGKEIARLAGDADWSSLEAVNFVDALLEN